jgi:hypothetical protein
MFECILATTLHQNINLFNKAAHKSVERKIVENSEKKGSTLTQTLETSKILMRFQGKSSV